jgi:glutaredoxin 3
MSRLPVAVADRDQKCQNKYTSLHQLAKISMQPNIEIYTWQSCPFCIKAKALLKSKGVEFTEYAIDGDNQARDKMADRANGKRSLPQIFIDDAHIGGCDDIHALNAQGKLDALLKIA